MRVAIFDSDQYVREFFGRENAAFGHELVYFEPRLSAQTIALAEGFEGVCCFVNDRLFAQELGELAHRGVKFVALRCAGYNNVDLDCAKALGIRVARVPAYSPHAVAEHAVALLLCLNRKVHKSYNRVRDLNFATQGLLGFDLQGKTVGVIGTGKIGAAFAGIMKGFGCEVIAADPRPVEALVAQGLLTYVALDELYQRSDVISLHAPLMPSTFHLINDASLAKMKPGVVLINTSRGALIDARALVGALKTGHVGAAGLDVYEEEEGIFYEDLSNVVLQNDLLARLLTFPNMLITAHQGYLTREALTQIARVSLTNLQDFEKGHPSPNELQPLPKAA